MKNKKYTIYREKKSNKVWWVKNPNSTGEFLFTIDKKKLYNLFSDYPEKLSVEEWEVFNNENPCWEKFFSKRNRDYELEHYKEIHNSGKRLDGEKVQFDDEWKTIKGTHVLIDDYGRISKGPAALKMLDKWEKKRASKKASFELCDEMKPRHADYDFDSKDDIHGFIHKNMETTKAIYEEEGMDGVEDEWFKVRMEQSTKDLRVISDKEIDKAIDDYIDTSVARQWIVEYNHQIKPKLVTQLTSSPEIRNAALNIMYENYVVHTKYAEGKQPLSYEEFLVTPIKMYRGGSGKEYKKASVFSSYTFDKKVAEKFKASELGHGKATDKGTVYEAEIRPIDTYGSLNTEGEMEIFVPRSIAPNGRFDSETTV